MASSQFVAAKFSELLEGSHNLPNSTSKLGKVLLNLGEIQSCVRSHISESSKTESRVHYLLAGSGFDAQHVSAAIKAIDYATPGPQFSDQHKKGEEKARVVSLLAAKNQDSVQSSIDDLIAQSTKEFEQFLSAKIQVDWKARKQLLYQALGFATGPQALQNTTMMDTVDISLNADVSTSAVFWNKSRVGREILGQAVASNSLLNSPTEFEELRSKVSLVVDAWHRGQQANIIDILETTSSGHSSRGLLQINLMWKALKEMVGGQPAFRDLSSARGGHPDSPSAIDLTLRIIRASKTHLQQQFKKVVDAEIESRRLEAKVGGTPSSINKTKAFVRLKNFGNGQWKSGLELIDGQPLWAYSFYLLRAGCQEEAVQVLDVSPDMLGSAEIKFVNYFKDWVASTDKRLKPEQEETLHSYYLTYFREGRSFDVYKQALFKIIGRCDLQHKNLPQVVITIEDWLWLQLYLIQDSPSESVLNETYRLSQLQSLILELGPAKFQGGNGDDVSSNYFTILILAGLYEDAIAYLLPHNEPLAVQFAIALSCYGLIRPLSDPRSAEVNTAGADIVNLDHYSRVLIRKNAGDPRPELNIAEVLGRYTRLFRASAPEKAVDYLVLISLSASVAPEYKKLATEALQQLVLESREYILLLGSSANGVPNGTDGVIQKRASLLGFSDDKQYRTEMVQECAELANQEGRVDAVLLFYLAGKFNEVLRLINAILSRAIIGARLGHRITTTRAHETSEQICVDDEPPHLARSILKLYDSYQICDSTSREGLATTRYLLGFVDALDAFADSKFEHCFELIDACGVVDLGPSVPSSKIRNDAMNFSRLDDQLARAVPSILMVMLEGCSRLMKQYSSRHRPMPADFKAQIRQRAANCVVFAGLIEFRMPRQIYARMNKLELEISS